MDNIKTTVAVIFGGCSPEYSISLQSAAAVIKQIDKTKFHLIMIGISSKGKWFIFDGSEDKIVNDSWCNTLDCTPVIVSIERDERCLLAVKPDGISKITVDVVFPVLHGKNGEDGTIQGMFELAGIPVAGCGVLSSALCMDKHRAHIIANAAGVKIPTAFVIERNTANANVITQAEQIELPLFVKPVKAGSSYGITKVIKLQDLPEAIELAFKYDEKVIIEECISGFEVGCAVLGNETLTIGEVDEIELSDGFFNFVEKYTLETSAIHLPARVSKSVAEKIKQTAQVIYKALDCSGFARVDMFLTDSGKIIFNEVNTIPGFTEHSRYPNMMKAKGLSFTKIITEVIELAVKK